MSRSFFTHALEPVANFWRIYRRDGVALGFTTHDRDLWFAGLLHRAAPGMLPSAIRRNASLEGDSAEVEGALAHDAISAADLASGRYDEARIRIGVVDWETLEHAVLYHGEIGGIVEESGRFSAELRSTKAELEKDPFPRTSPTCRAEFCGPGCTLAASRFTHEAALTTIDLQSNSVRFSDGPAAALLEDGWLRWLDGPQAGIRMEIVEVGPAGLRLDIPLDQDLQPGARAQLREGCDHTVSTCAARFANAVNFQGEPFLPGNDLLARYAVPAA